MSRVDYLKVSLLYASVVELVDTLDLESSDGDIVRVRLSPGALAIIIYTS
jgi:hypothetical protein